MRILRAFVAPALVVAIVQPMALQGGGGGGRDDDDVFATVQGIQFGRPPASGGADNSGCHWIRNSSGIIDDAFFVEDKVIAGVAYRAFLKSCPGLLPTLAWVPQLSARQVAQASVDYVKERLSKPTVLAAPALDSGVVNVGMWFWTDFGRYQPLSVTVWIPGVGGPIWATTTAVPTVLVYDSGEPAAQPVTCAGPGQVWTAVDGDDAVSDCMFTYSHSSAVSGSGVFAARLSIVWELSWASNAGAGGDLGIHQTSTEQLVTVNEIQALITS